MKSTILNPAYAAGILDGEGCFTIGFSRKAKSYDARIYLGMTEPGKTILEAMADDFGGKVRVQRKSTKIWETAYVWTITGRKTVPLLKVVIDRLKIKMRQAKLLLSLEELKAANAVNEKCRWTTELRQQAASIRATILDLNRKGPDIPRTPPLPGAIFVLDVDGFLMEPTETGLFDPSHWQPYSGSFGNTIISDASGLWTLDTSEFHSEEGVYSECSLETILQPDAPPKYSLSPKAAAGILRRAAKRNRTLPARLEGALRALASQLPEEGEKTTKT